MTNTASKSPLGDLFTAGPLVLLALIVVAALTRVLPHPPNFSPVAALALFGGACFLNRRWAVFVPLLALMLSDLVLARMHGGLYGTWFSSAGIWMVYGATAVIAVMGFGLRGRVGGASVLGYSLGASVFFFLSTNAGAWLADPMYPKTFAGLGAAYAAGLPFFQWTVAGTLAYSAALFGGFALLRRQLPVLRAQTA